MALYAGTTAVNSICRYMARLLDTLWILYTCLCMVSILCGECKGISNDEFLTITIVSLFMMKNQNFAFYAFVGMSIWFYPIHVQ